MNLIIDVISTGVVIKLPKGTVFPSVVSIGFIMNFSRTEKIFQYPIFLFLNIE